MTSDSGTGGAAWQGAGASLLLHLFAGVAVIAALSGPPKAPPQVIDLTLLPPAETGRRPSPTAFLATEETTGISGTADRPDPTPAPGPPPSGESPIVPVLPAAPSTPAAPNPPGGTVHAKPSPPAETTSASVRGSSHGPAATAASTGTGPAGAPRGIPPRTAGVGTAGAGTGGAETAAGGYTWIRDAIQNAIAYPPTARRMGWEGKVVVGFHLLPDGSVRDVRIVESSGYSALDRGAIVAVRTASPFPRTGVEAEIITPVVYRLAIR